MIDEDTDGDDDDAVASHSLDTQFKARAGTFFASGFSRLDGVSLAM
jgi:hypothetical protein